MLRIDFLQRGLNISAPTVEEVLDDPVSMRPFVGIDLGRETAPDETTLLRFRHLLETRGLGKTLFDDVAGLFGPGA